MARREDLDQPDKLDFDAPILTRRRPISGTSQPNSKHWQAREMSAPIETGGGCVPFLWEKAPGMPKHLEVNGGHVTEEIPSPKPPPNRWRPNRRCCKNDDEEDEDVFIDAMDMISLSESFDVACSMNQTSTKSSSLNSEALKSAGSLPPNFIIRRFLPAANALASSSVQALGRSPSHERGRAPCRKVSKSFSSYLSTNTRSSSMEHDFRPKLRSNSPPIACGLDLLSHLRLKHTICGLGSPVKGVAPHVKLVKRQNKAGEDGFSCYESKRKKEKLNDGIMGRGKVSNLDGERGVRNEDEFSSMERLDSRSAPESRGRNEWFLPSRRSPL